MTREGGENKVKVRGTGGTRRGDGRQEVTRPPERSSGAEESQKKRWLAGGTRDWLLTETWR